jgi:uncharacterized protein (DUF1778 family)
MAKPMSVMEVDVAPRKQSKAGTIHIRVEPTKRDVIDRAAAIAGKDRSAFMLEAAYREAERVLLDRRLFALDDEAYAEFMAAIDAPPADNPRLRKLLVTPAPWEK